MSGLIAGATLVGGAIAGRGAKKAGESQLAGTQAGIAETGRQFDLTRADLAPWMEAGERALGQYEEYGAQPSRVLEGDYIPAVSPFQFGAAEFEQYKDPGYQWRVGEGERGVNRAAASMGQLGSGNRLRALMELNQQMGSQEFGQARGRAQQDYATNVLAPYQRGVDAYGRAYGAEGDYLNRLAGLSNVGQSTATNLGQFGASAAQNTSNMLMAGGEAQKESLMGQYGAWGSALSDLGRQFQDYNKPQGGYGSAGGGGGVPWVNPDTQRTYTW